ncbi:hypothetical protein ONZ45_g19092 [Pleurotus djamor]|nr:hypothetical protein ONZ45_g19092 [Pleurotus djamor]
MNMKLTALVIALSAIFVQATSDKAHCGNIVDTLDAYPACKPSATPEKFQPLAFNSSKWIWTGEVATPGGNNPLAVRGFRKSVASPSGKCATCAELIVTADDSVQVFVNGILIGGNANWRAGSILFTALKPSSNVFAFLGNNSVIQTPAGVFATIKIHYADGTSDTVVTDESWKTLQNATPPDSFAQVTFDDSTWTAAVVQGTWDKSPWGKTTLPPVLPLSQSNWIWTSEAQGTPENLGSRAFLIVADESYTLWVNGKVVGSGRGLSAADAWSIPGLEPTFNVFAINGTNNIPVRGAVVGTILITYSDGTTSTLVTDASWLVSRDVSDGFAENSVDESSFTAATEVVKFGAPTWPVPVIPPA